MYQVQGFINESKRNFDKTCLFDIFFLEITNMFNLIKKFDKSLSWISFRKNKTYKGS